MNTGLEERLAMAGDDWIEWMDLLYGDNDAPRSVNENE